MFIFIIMNDERYLTTNTCTRKPQFNQIISYILYLTETLVYFLIVQDNYQASITKIIMNTFYCITLAALCIFAFATSYIDPVDPVLLQFLNGNRANVLPILDSCLYCDTCRSYVKSTSRHCKLCNRCVDKFDHHCIWINNCIGVSNYKTFIAMISFAAANFIVFITSVGLLWAEGHSHMFREIMGLAWALFAICLIFSVLIVGLLFLHIFLIIKGLTTFEFIMQKRESEKNLEMIARQKQITNNNTEQNIINLPKSNKVIGLTEEVIFNQTDGKTSQYDSEKPADQIGKKHIHNIPSLPKNNDSEDKDLKQFYERHKSLKLLIGNSVAVKPYSERYERNYSSNKFLLRFQSQQKQKIKNKQFSSLKIKEQHRQ